MGTRRIAGSENLVVLDQRVREQALAHLGQLCRILDVELDQPADVDIADPAEPERGQRPLDRLALRIENSRLRPDEHAGPHHAPVHRSHTAARIMPRFAAAMR